MTVIKHVHIAILALILVLAGSTPGQDAPTGSTFAIDWQTIDGGGGVSTAGALRLVSTIGQPDPGTAIAGDLQLNGGFLPGTVEIVAPCPADVSGDGLIDVTDLLQLLAAWGPCTGCPEDTSGDGNVDVTDLLALLAAWGACP